ncbi:MAG: aminodeoxychorismate/anthranilate synthase component II [Verrucomicrobiota bacterium]|nr:aminodeoxychorismate/anthranilate synthase component II [Verrucomicrobiota bacterium]
MKLLLIDNYDSFTYNLAQIFGELGAEVIVRRNDQIASADVRALAPDRICISPGPGRPEDASVSSTLIREFGATIPVLGVCLGHQCIAQVFGGEIVRAPVLMHGKTSAISHRGEGVFKDLAQPFEATRYHSLVVNRDNFPDALAITAESDDGEIMGLRHSTQPIHGVQFHPESILTSAGAKLLANFLKGTPSSGAPKCFRGRRIP